MDDFGALMS